MIYLVFLSHSDIMIEDEILTIHTGLNTKCGMDKM